MNIVHRAGRLSEYCDDARVAVAEAHINSLVVPQIAGVAGADGTPAPGPTSFNAVAISV